MTPASALDKQYATLDGIDQEKYLFVTIKVVEFESCPTGANDKSGQAPFVTHNASARRMIFRGEAYEECMIYFSEGYNAAAKSKVSSSCECSLRPYRGSYETRMLSKHP